MTGTQAPPQVRVTLHALEFRQDRDEWIVGRQGHDRIVALPPVGVDALRLLEAGHTVGETQERLRADTGRLIDVGSFVEGLTAAGLVATVGDRSYPAAPLQQPHPWLDGGRFRWTLHPAVHAAALTVPVLGAAVLLLSSRPLPSFGGLLWSPYGSVNLLVQSAVTWCLIALHELAHLLTARAAGVSARVRLGTRLQFLVAQTEASGIWLKGRRERLTVYLAGLACNGVICGACLLAMGLGARSFLMDVIVMTLVLSFANQCMIFMRTDVYFVLQDLSGCRDLYGDAGRYLRHLARRAGRRLGDDPLRALRPAERSVVRAYALFASVGSAVCVYFGLRVLLDVTVPLLRRSATRLTSPEDMVLWLDSAVTLSLLVALQVLWARMWWGSHGPRVRALARKAAGKRT
ncbi:MULTISPECIES: hypothetical protein [unclassified Streptomyces]|uniref:hypothetical protein n=1 Tax=unclassified Streptomyces TaxID=2593676 RepID=UPI0036E7591B